MKTTVAVLGAGGWGANWTERALRDPEVEVRAVADTDPNVLDRLAARGIPRDRLFSDAGAALDSGLTDAVTCSVPNPDRPRLLERCVAEGRHVLVDKPVVHTGEALRSLLDATRRSGRTFMVAQNYRNFAGVRRMKELLDGCVAPVAGMHVHFLRSAEHLRHSFVRNLSGAVPLGLEMCIHHLDMMRFLLGADPVRIEARGWRTPWSPGAGLDALDIHLEFPNGACVAYDADWGAAWNATDWPGHWEIVGEGGTLSYGREGRALRAYAPTGEIIEDAPGPDPDVDTKRSVDAVWASFRAAIAADRGDAGAGFCPLEDNAKSLGMALAVIRSVEAGAPVDYAAFMRECGLDAAAGWRAGV